MSTCGGLKIMTVRRRLNITGTALIFITTTVRNRIPVFKDYKLADLVVRQLKETAGYYMVSIVGYVLMPSHLHIMLGLRKAELSSRFMQSFKIITSKKLKSLLPESYLSIFSCNGEFRFWTPRFDELGISSKKQFDIKLNYIHNNPVKAGLAKDAIEYEFSSAKDWLTEYSGLLPVDKEFSFS